MASLGFKSDTLTPGILAFPPRLQAALTALFEFYAPRVQSYARTNAKWTDRTSNARNGLTAEAEHYPGTHRIVLFHRMPYGIWLEVRFNGRYAIIVPTIKNQGREIMRSTRGLIAKMKAGPS